MSEMRILDALRAIVREALPRYPYLGPRRYRVARMSGDRVELQIVAPSPGLPDLLPILMAPGIPGLTTALTPGGMVLVEFVDGDPAQPIVTHYGGSDGASWRPVSMSAEATQRIDIDAPTVTVGELPAARRGDLVASGSKTIGTACTVTLILPAVGEVAGAVATLKPGTQLAGTITFPNLLSGQIVTGRG